MKNLNINCPIGNTGYGITSLNIVKFLSQLDVNISLFPIGNNISLNSEEDKFIIEKALQNSSSFDYQAPCLKIWHQHDLANKIGNGHYYSFPFFEIDKLNEREVHHLNYCDGIFVASQWGKEILENNGVVKPIVVSPLGVDTNIFKTPDKIRIEKPNYVFLNVGKYEKRKGQDLLLRCFDLAFNEEDNVELWMMPFAGRVTEEQQKEFFSMIENVKLKSKIKLYKPVPTQYDLANIIDNSDCGIFLSRAEGWNNEIPEFMALNKPIITTNYSAHTEYCNANNSYLIDIDEIEPAFDNTWFFGNGNWAKFSEKQIEQTVEYMRFVYRNNIKTNPSGLDTAAKYSWNNTVSIIDQTLNNNKSYNATTTKKRERKPRKVSK